MASCSANSEESDVTKPSADEAAGPSAHQSGPSAVERIAERDKLNERTGHVSVLHKNHVYIWGGYSETPWNKNCSCRGHEFRYYPPDEVVSFNWVFGVWDVLRTTGDIPGSTAGASALYYENHMYLFGGTTTNSDPLDDDWPLTHKLNLFTLEWTELKPRGRSPMACDKFASWIYDDKFYFFGGYGFIPHDATTNRHLFVVDLSSWNQNSCWNKQLYSYDPARNLWESVRTEGPPPSARAGHAAAIDERGYVFIFGGSCGTTRNNEMHVLHMPTLTWITENVTICKKQLQMELLEEGEEVAAGWDGIPLNEMGGESVLEMLCVKKPNARSWHSLTYVGNGNFLLYGGLDNHNNVSHEAWLATFDAEERSVSWKMFNLEKSWPRFWHRAEYIPSEREVVVIGGHIINMSPLYATFPRVIIARFLRVQADNFLSFNFGARSLQRIAVDYVIENISSIGKERVDSLPIHLKNAINLRILQQF